MPQLVVADLVVSSRKQRDFELNQAVELAQEQAERDQQHGILVTRHRFSRYSVVLTPAVPFGMIHEHDLTSA